ncbi:ABC transporter substrate-binding protein [Lampropedia puyangensis]|uniref:ABC transporter substrate-binding protein n=1 Tax=Lampropedia puyangensis TaxID=1330072 RepID=A0A4S8EUH0_9BURK|nr:ABC transporter substrate-binding protein [Lampropedia puyangensis]THT98098.1 ABC transporter substrate-binding protein [Lampropedia puyangensis]
MKNSSLRQWIPAIALALVANAGLAAEPQKGGTLFVALNPEPTVLNISYHNQYANAVVSSNIYEGLVVYDENQQPQPALATAWEVAPDGLSITFRLRQGVKWHDGTSFTSADVKFSALEIWKKLHPRGRVTFAPLKDVETPDAHTVVFRLEHPALVILSALNTAEAQVLPAHLYEGTDVRTNPYNNKPVGTGPFRFKKWEKGQFVELERNPDYWDAGKPHLDRLIFRTIPDAAARGAALETGEVQVVPFAGVPFSDVQRLRDNKELAFTKKGYEYNSQIYYLEFNIRNAPLSNVKVRQALAHAINKQGLAETIFYGVTEAADSPIPKSLTRFYAQDIPRYDYDLKKAEALLDEAGYPRQANGKRFAISINLSPSSERFPFAGESLRQDFSRIGVELNPIALDVASYLKAVYTDYKFDSLIQGYSTLMDPQMGLTRLFWSKAAKPGVSYANATGYANAETDQIIEAYQREADPAKRVEQFHALQRQILTDLPAIPLVDAPFFTIYNKKLHGLDERPDASRSSYADAWLAK